MAKKNAKSKGYRKTIKKKPFLTKKEIIELIVILAVILLGVVLFNIFYDDGFVKAHDLQANDIVSFASTDLRDRYKKVAVANELEGFTKEERGKMTELLAAGFVDTFRHLYPDLTGAYSWWSYMAKSRERNIGWRIDYFIVSESLRNAVREASIHADVMGSDHCPVGLILAI